MKAQIPLYSTICKKYDCTHFIIWEYQKGYKLESCKMVGQSETVDTIPQDCPYFKEMEELKNKKCESCSFADIAPN